MLYSNLDGFSPGLSAARKGWGVPENVQEKSINLFVIILQSEFFAYIFLRWKMWMLLFWRIGYTSHIFHPPFSETRSVKTKLFLQSQRLLFQVWRHLRRAFQLR